MRHLLRSLCLLAIAAACVAGPGAASAESRLFSARTDQPGVTVVGAVRAGKQLAVAGQGNGATFFRIDNPAGAVPCANRILFTASNGRNVDTTVDLCASNWELVLSVAGTGVPAPGGPSQAVVITTDDPSITISEVFLKGKPVTITGRQGTYVQIKVIATPQGFECSRDLGLALSDGRRIARLVDICQTSFLVVIPLVGGPTPPPPPPSMRPVPQPTPVPPQPTPPLPPPPPNVVSDMTWLFSATSSRASLAFAIPNSDDSEFIAGCAPRSSKTSVTLSRTAPGLVPGGKVAVRFSAGSFSKVYTAVGSQISEMTGMSHPVIQIPTTDPLWAAMIKESALGIAISAAPPYALSLKGSATKAKQFLAVCGPAPAPLPQPLPLPQPGPANAVAFACNDGSFVSIAFDANTAVVSEPGAPPIVLFRTPSQGGYRYAAGLSQLIGEDEQVYWTRDGGYARTCAMQ